MTAHLLPIVPDSGRTREELEGRNVPHPSSDPGHLSRSGVFHMHSRMDGQLTWRPGPGRAENCWPCGPLWSQPPPREPALAHSRCPAPVLRTLWVFTRSSEQAAPCVLSVESVQAPRPLGCGRVGTCLGHGRGENAF